MDLRKSKIKKEIKFTHLVKGTGLYSRNHISFIWQRVFTEPGDETYVIHESFTLEKNSKDPGLKDETLYRYDGGWNIHVNLPNFIPVDDPT